MTAIELNEVRKRFGATPVIHGVDLKVDDGEFCVFVGPSGCGKSTLLRMIAGLEDVSDGAVLIDGQVVNEVEPARRKLAMVFQSYALYPHMTVEQNMSFGLRMTGTSRAETSQRVAEATRILQLGALLKRKPAQLSGGQRQRVAIGRAIVRQPRAFLFDEPLSNLDAELRVQMRVEIAKLHQDLGATMIYVTHDQVEAMTLADKIVVLRDGRVEQAGRPSELYNDPGNRFVAGFIGSPKMNFLPVLARDGMLDAGGGLTLPIPPGHRLAPATELEIGIRPERFDAAYGGTVPVPITIRVVENLGGSQMIHGSTAGGAPLVVELRGSEDLKPGETISPRVSERDLFLFDPAGQRIRPA
jgi:lactose/L-arabinose transport system ATP-binding protein